jgi:hypothetical protein
MGTAQALFRLARSFGFCGMVVFIVNGVYTGDVPVLGQDSTANSDQDGLQAFAQALQQIDRDYVDFLNRRTRIEESYAQVLKSLRESEQDLQRIGNEAIRQQMAAIQARLQSARMDSMMEASRQRRDGRDNPNGRDPNNFLAGLDSSLKAQTQAAIAGGKTSAEMQFALRNSELQQLDAASQAVIRKRLENFQRLGTLEEEYSQWNQDWSKFFVRYWPYSDFERAWNEDKVQEAIKVLNLAHQDNFAAILTNARLKCRVGLTEDALTLVDRVLDSETPLKPIAMAIKAEVLMVDGKDGASKAALQSALKMEKDNPYVRWLRADLLADQKQYNLVEPIWTSFLKDQVFELPARRRLALLYFNRALSAKGKKGDADFVKAVKAAELGLELEAKPTYLSHLVYGIALYGLGKNEEALQQIDKASDKASGESLELCRDWEQKVKDGEVEPWLFLTTFSEK